MGRPSDTLLERKPASDDVAAMARAIWDLSTEAGQAFNRSLRNVKTVTAAYTMDPVLDRILMVSGTTTITLPDAAAADHVEYTIVRTGTNTVSVTSVAGTLNGVDIISVPLTLTTQYHSVTVASDGSNYFRTDNL